MTDVIEAAPPDTQPGRPRRRWRMVLLGVLAAFVLVAGVGGVWVSRQLNPPGKPGAAVSVVIPKGTTTRGIATILHHDGVITNTLVFRLYLRYEGAGPFRAGTYSMRRHESMHEVVKILEAGEKLQLDRVTIPEGLSRREIAARWLLQAS